MRKPYSLEKTLMLGKIKGRRRRGRHRMRWLDGITDSLDPWAPPRSALRMTVMTASICAVSPVLCAQLSVPVNPPVKLWNRAFCFVDG